MVPVRYPGVPNPMRAFGELRLLWQQLTAMQIKVRPFGPEYLILEAVMKALDTAAYHFTREPNFFTAKPEQSRYRPPKGDGARHGATWLIRRASRSNVTDGAAPPSKSWGRPIEINGG